MPRLFYKAKLAKVIQKAEAYISDTYEAPIPESMLFDANEIKFSLTPIPKNDDDDLADFFYRVALEMERKKEMTFVEKVNSLILQKKVRETTVYKAAQMDRRLFSKIMSDINYKPSKDTAVAIALAFRLTLDEATDLLKRAGYTLSHSDKRDIVIEFFFRERVYDLFDANYILSEFQMKCIGR